MQVDRALVDRRRRAAGIDVADHLAGVGVDDRHRVAAGAAQRHRRGRELVGAARDERAVGALAQLARADQHLRELAPARAQHVRVGGLQRRLVRRAQQVRGVELLVLVVEDRGLDRPLEELVRVAAEELVERVLAGDVDRQPAPAPPRAAPHLAQRRDGPRERHADRRVQRADVDPELQRVRRHDAQQLAVDEPPLELAPLLRPCSPRGRARSAPPAPRCPRRCSSSVAKRAISSTALRDFMNTIVRAPSITSSASRSAASASAERRAAVAGSVIGGFHIATVRFVPGEPSRSITVTSSSPVSRVASSPGLAIVAEASRNRGAVP